MIGAILYTERFWFNGVEELGKGWLLRTVQQSPGATPTALVEIRIWRRKRVNRCDNEYSSCEVCFRQSLDRRKV